MRRRLTITISEEVYRGLHQRVGRHEISHFIENLIRPQVVNNEPLLAEYRRAAEDEAAEREALAWIESDIDEGVMW